MRRTAAMICGAVLACASCAGEAAAATHVVVIDRMAFQPETLELRIGDVVEWRNEDAVPHTATAPAAGFDVVLLPGEVKRSTIGNGGAFEVTCRFHPGMRMRLDARVDAAQRSPTSRWTRHE